MNESENKRKTERMDENGRVCGVVYMMSRARNPHYTFFFVLFILYKKRKFLIVKRILVGISFLLLCYSAKDIKARSNVSLTSIVKRYEY